MTLPFKKKKQETDASARVVDGKLVLSLPDAVSPIVWQMDLTTVKASALEITHNEEKNTHTLTLKTIKGENAEVATFKTRAHALEGLMCASNALEGAQGQIRQAEEQGASHSANTHGTQKKGAKRTVLKVILALLALYIVFTIWSFTLPISQTSGNSVSNTASSTSAQSSSGVPVDANDFLSGR